MSNDEYALGKEPVAPGRENCTVQDDGDNDEDEDSEDYEDEQGH